MVAAQFESFQDTFIITLTVPFFIAGALLSLHFTDQTLNVFSEIGIILSIALSPGASGGSRQSLGIAVIGWLIYSGLLTLLVVPAIYAIFSRNEVEKQK